MKKWILPGGIAAVLFLAIAGGAYALTGGLDDDDDGGRQSTLSDAEDGDELEGDAARCAEGATDCDDTGGGQALGMCISEDDPNYDPDIPCNDMVVEDGGDDSNLNTCIAGSTDCVDTPTDGGQQPVTSIDGIDPDECNAVHNIDACERIATEAAFAALAGMNGPLAGEMTVTETRFVEWGNACLGVEQPGVACAEVITPGFIVVLDNGVLGYKFHTDMNGNAVLAEPAE